MQPAGGQTVVVIDADAEQAAVTAIAEAVRDGSRTAVWAGTSSDAALEEFRAELGRHG